MVGWGMLRTVLVWEKNDGVAQGSGGQGEKGWDWKCGALGPELGITNSMLFSLRACGFVWRRSTPERGGAAGRRARKRARAYLVHARAELHKRVGVRRAKLYAPREKHG